MRCADCGFVMYVNPAAAVAVFVVNKKGELLVCVRGNEPAKGTYDLPGGFVDEGETALEAAARELKEELGLTVMTPRYLYSIPNEYTFSGWTLPTLDLFFEVTVSDDFVPTAADDVSECFYIAKAHIDPQRFGLKSVREAVEIYSRE